MGNDYLKLNNYQSCGEIGISQKAFETIASIACNNVAGASVKQKNSRLFFLDQPVSASLRKDGKVQLRLDVVLAKGAEVQKVCSTIQEEVANAISLMCETVAFRIEVKVVAVR
jgi:uncharacterized alkaline shock family protein YloU